MKIRNYKTHILDSEKEHISTIRKPTDIVTYLKSLGFKSISKSDGQWLLEKLVRGHSEVEVYYCYTTRLTTVDFKKRFLLDFILGIGE
jgi:hypothetical protein